MDICNSDIRCCILIRGIRSSTTKELVESYCEKYGQINYCRSSISPQGIMRGYNIVFKQEQAVNRFMDDRPHRIDGQSVKVKRCISPVEEWRLTNEILITTLDNSTDNQIIDEQILRDYFSKYGTIRAFHIDTYHNRPCAYLTFTDYDRVDQLINDKPHTIDNIMINVRKHLTNDNKNMHKPSKQNSNTKRRQYSSVESEHHRIKRYRSSSNNIISPTINIPSKMMIKQEATTNYEDNDLIRLKNANDLLIREVQSLISTPTQSNQKTNNNNEILRLQNDYQCISNRMMNFRNEQIGTSSNDHTNAILDKLKNDVENLLRQIKNIQQQQQQQKKTFDDELFEKYSIKYILSLNEDDVKQRLEQLEKENQLLLLIKQNMPKTKMPKIEPL